MMNQRLVERKNGIQPLFSHTHTATATNDLSHIATTTRYLVTALATVVALETEPSSSDKDGSGETFEKKKKSVNSGYDKGNVSNLYRTEVNISTLVL